MSRFYLTIRQGERDEYIDMEVYNFCHNYTREKYEETYDYFAGFILKKWTFFYSDGDVETVEQKEFLR